ncbi:hypothetical protein WJX84_000227 [Apatococcus fuscideae]|uniref:PDEase domain-containing protein n=1 Tax=Apatococcus fuscideae TaxID=2026836 RepID=A0AAW1T0M9_9CHLO
MNATHDLVSGNLSVISEQQIATSVVPINNIVEWLLQDTGTIFSFNVFELAEATSNRPLSVLGFYMLKGSGLVSQLALNEERLARLLMKIEAGYLDNPYHSCIHAAGVLQSTHLLAQNAICHDYAHPGVTNDFLIKSKHQLATVYNDTSPVENMHVSSMFRVLYGKENLHFAEHLNVDSRNLLRASSIDLILGTDMKKHFSMLSRFQTQGRGRLVDLPGDAKLLVAQMALKVADIAHLSAPTQVHKRWTAQLTEEFFQQGDRERALNMSILMDRSNSAGMVKSQDWSLKSWARCPCASAEAAGPICNCSIKLMQSG